MQYVNNTRTAHNFKFDGVLGEKATQVGTEILRLSFLINRPAACLGFGGFDIGKIFMSALREGHLVD